MNDNGMTKMKIICGVGFSDRVFFSAGLLMLFSELLKQLLLTVSVGNGSYIWWYFPFQLCSIPMYLMPLLPFVKGRSLHAVILCFLSTYSLLGGACAFFDTSGMHYALPILTIHSYVWHVCLILIGMYAGLCHLFQVAEHRKNARPSRRTFCLSTLLFFLSCAAATAFNLSLSRFGEINMFYINPLLPMNQLLFRDITSRFGNASAIGSYLTSIVLASFLLFQIWNLLYLRLLRPNAVRIGHQ